MLSPLLEGGKGGEGRVSEVTCENTRVEWCERWGMGMREFRASRRGARGAGFQGLGALMGRQGRGGSRQGRGGGVAGRREGRVR